MSNNGLMERLDQITPEWIKQQLGPDRGRQARFAEAIGVRPDMVSKIKSGVRRLQPHEVPLALKFFGFEVVAVTAAELGMLELFRKAPADRQAAVEVLLAFQPRQQEKP